MSGLETKPEENKFYLETMKLVSKVKKNELKEELRTVKDNIKYCKEKLKEIRKAKRVSD